MMVKVKHILQENKKTKTLLKICLLGIKKGVTL